jgi:imidazolonepropionase-like amidohydrolase
LLAAAENARQPTIAIENVAVVDVVKGRVTEPRTVVISDGRIATISEPTRAAVPTTAVRVDGQGRYLMPGLIDMHVHLFNNATHRPPNDWTFSLFVASGVTGVREMRSEISDLALVERWRARVASRELIAPKVLSAGVAVRGQSPDSARREVREADAAGGVGFIKIFSEVPEPNWRAILEEARALSLPVCGHIPAEVTVVAAAKAGQESNEHLTQIYEACSRNEKKFLAKRHGLGGNEAVKLRDAQEQEVLESFEPRVCEETAKTLALTRQVQVPTLVLAYFEAGGARKQFRTDPRWPSLRPDEQERWQRIIDREPSEVDPVALQRWKVSREIVKTLHKAGNRILAGTDAPMPLVYPGSSLHKELKLLVECGLSPADALRAATIWPAEFLGLDESSGSIGIGKRADLVLLDDNPLREIKNTQRIRSVVLDGQLLQRDELDALLAGKAK